MYDEETQLKEENSKRRPFFIWIIAIYYIGSFILSIYSWYMIKSGSLPISNEQTEFLVKIPNYVIAISMVIGVINCIGSIFLIMQKKIAFYLIGLGVLSSIIYSLVSFFTEIGGPNKSILGTVIGIIIELLIMLYITVIVKKGKLNK
jgi:hypothetical protein